MLNDFSPVGLHHFFYQYGSAGIFFLLALGIFGLPVPDETLIIIMGFLLAKAYIPATSVLPAVYIGSMLGITLSYLVGLKVGKPILFRFGKKIGITHKRLEKTHNWCEKYGKWSLIIGYYIPGIRHLFGISAGVVNLSYREFALFAYVGAFIWASIFLCVGYFFYHEWIMLLH